jgi:hypothetical protein
VRRFARVLALAALLAGCAVIDGGPEEWSYDGPVNACGAAGGCAAGACDAELGACVVDPPTGETLYARIVPDPATNAPAQVHAVTVAGGQLAAPLTVRVPVTVTGGTVVLNADGGTSSLLGRVVFSDVGNRLPGRPPQVTVYDAYNSSVFDLSLLPSTYDIVVIPGGPQADSNPIAYYDGVALDTAGALTDAGGEPFDVIVPPSAATVTGRITLAEAPVNGLEVVAFDPATGRIVSTTDEIGYADAGTFAIGLAAAIVESGAPFSLRVSRPDEEQYPVFEAGGFTPPAAGGALDLTGDARLAFGALGVPVRFQAKVLEPVPAAGGAYDTAPSCFVAFRSTDVGGGAVEKWVLSNESGELEEIAGIPGVYLYPGDYSVTVVPAFAPAGATSDYAAYASPSPIAIYEDNLPGEVELLLGWRPLVAGEVIAGGSPVPSSAIAAAPAVGASDTARPNSAISGGTGEFRLWLDAAPYVVTAEAPAESRYAWQLVEATVPSGGAVLALELPLPFSLRGAIAASSEQVDPVSVAGAVVEWYREIGGRAFAIGRSVADADGAFAALLPR